MSNDLHLDDEARALQDAINATPEDDEVDTKGVSSEPAPAKKGSSKATKIILGIGGLMLVSMGGAYFAMEAGLLNQAPPPKVRKGPPPLTDEKPVAPVAVAEPVVDKVALATPAPVVTTPVANANMQPAANVSSAGTDPFKQAEPPVQATGSNNDPFKTTAPSVPDNTTPVKVVEPIKEVTAQVKPVETVKEVNLQKPKKSIARKSYNVEQPVVERTEAKITPKKSVVKKTGSKEIDNGYVRLF